MKTPISYYGGKQALLNHILPLIPEHDLYTEVFFGGGAVFFAKIPAKTEVINDNLDIVINFYKVVVSNFYELKLKVEATLISRSLHQKALKIIKNYKTADKIDLAWAFWLSMTFAFSNKIGGGLKYTNQNGQEVPNLLKTKKKEFDYNLKKRIENAYIEKTDALKVLRSRNIEKAFHYIDPPYFNADQGHYAGYTEEDFQKVLEFLSHECKGKFLLSNYNSEILERYISQNNWNKKEISKKISANHINAKNKGRIKTEVLVWNYDLPDDLFKRS